MKFQDTSSSCNNYSYTLADQLIVMTVLALINSQTAFPVACFLYMDECSDGLSFPDAAVHYYMIS